jgi:hypothetical protein
MQAFEPEELVHVIENGLAYLQAFDHLQRELVERIDDVEHCL